MTWAIAGRVAQKVPQFTRNGEEVGRRQAPAPRQRVRMAVSSRMRAYVVDSLSGGGMARTNACMGKKAGELADILAPLATCFNGDDDMVASVSGHWGGPSGRGFLSGCCGGRPSSLHGGPSPNFVASVNARQGCASLHSRWVSIFVAFRLEYRPQLLCPPSIRARPTSRENRRLTERLCDTLGSGTGKAALWQM